MARTNVHVDSTDPDSVERLIDAFEVRSTDYEDAIRMAASLHDRPFVLYIDHVSQTQLSPLDDAFTFDLSTGELILFSDDAGSLVDALLDMAMFQHGFNTFMGANDEWKTQFAIGTWHYVRRALKAKLDIGGEATWRVGVRPEIVERFDLAAFSSVLYLAGHPDVELTFPPGANALVVTTYQRLARMMETVAFDISLENHEAFNRRLDRTMAWIEASILPDTETTLFDDLLGPEGFADHYFGNFVDSPDEGGSQDADLATGTR